MDVPQMVADLVRLYGWRVAWAMFKDKRCFCWNTYPTPEQIQAVKDARQEVLDKVRETHGHSG